MSMIVDRAWAKRNLGFDPIATPAPSSTFAFRPAARLPSGENLQREIIDFDSEAPAGREFLAFTTATGLSRFTDVSWPKALAPRTGGAPKGSSAGPLPRGDVLLVTWTVDEGHALSRVLTPGKDSRNDYRPYKHNYASIAKKMRPGCPARLLKRLGTYWTTKIGNKKVVVFKSDSHMSQDGPKLPNAEVWKQIIDEVRPTLVITTGTAGGIGKQFEVGDVVVSPIVRFDCTAKFGKAPFRTAHYSSRSVRRAYFPQATELFKANAGQLPKDNTRSPKIVRVSPKALKSSVVTTDFFGFDTSDNHYHLRNLGDVSEMGDAVLGLVCAQMGTKAPRWVAVRNVSDPQIKVGSMTLRQQAALAAHIYKAFGRWSSVCSAIVCWALIVAE
jgi:nucleoside phosphorylase